jgi:ectoine hydroxylase-related dioxygenase (phytanoyl-CoA dioxygenase family)
MVATSSLTRLRHTEDGTAAVLEALRADGAVVVEDMVGSDVVAAVNDEVAPFVDAADPTMRHLNPAIQAFFGDRTRHVASLAAKSPTFAERVMVHPVFADVCDAVLGPSCARWQLNLGHLIARGPGARRQVLHRDEDVWVHVPRPHPELQVASMTALVDFSVENGATRVVPGSHRWERARQPEDREVADAVMPAGATVIYLGSTLHGAGDNSTADVSRRGLHVSFTLGWLRTEENNYLGTPPEAARRLSPAAQAVLGYAVHDAIADAGGYLGMVEMRDPLELLAEG